MIDCWAKSLGNCGTEASKEHIVSAALWPGAKLLVAGFQWCEGGWKEVGVNALTSHILCKAHNNALSPLDDGAGAAFRQLRRAIVLVNERTNSPPPWPIEILRIERADLLERWFLKTMINIVVVKPGELRWRQGNRVARDVPESLVRLAFGLDRFVSPMGLYANAPMGQRLQLSESVTFAPLLYDGPNIVAGIFGLAGWQFLLHLEPFHLPPDLAIPSPHHGSKAAQLHYHLAEISNRVGTTDSHSIQFDWP